MRIFLSTLLFLAACSAFGEDGQRLLRVDHYVKVHSTVPAIDGQATQIYVREVVYAGAALREAAAAEKVVLFVHGAGTPAEVAFDVPYEDYSWMAYLARAGFGRRPLTISAMISAACASTTSGRSALSNSSIDLSAGSPLAVRRSFSRCSRS